MSKQFLLENPEIWGPRGLAFKATLFDGNPRNMEIADRGANLVNDNELLVYLSDSLGRTQPKLSTRQSDRGSFLRHPARKKSAGRHRRCQPARQRQRRRHQNRPDGHRHGASANGAANASEDRDDTTFTLIREAGGSSRLSRVLTPRCSAKTSAIPAANINCRRSRAACRRAASV